MEFIPLIISVLLIDFLSILTPGQDFAIVTRNTLRYSQSAGITTAGGISVITFFHALLAMTGLSALIAHSPDLMAGIRTIGAFYLIYLGGNFVKNAKNLELETSHKDKFKQKFSHWKCFKMGAIANIFNIEPIMAFVSIFAILLPTQTPLWVKLSICGLVTINTFLWMSFVSKIFSLSAVKHFAQHHFKKFEQIIGAVLLFLGFKTILTHKK